MSLQALEVELKRLEVEREQQLFDLIASLPAYLGLENFEDVIKHIKAHKKKHGEINNSPAQDIGAELKRDIESDLHKGGQISEISLKFGVSAPTIFKIRKEMGLFVVNDI